jgi:tripartite-type tricarboxylate transporter receptor subunit TctC
MQRRSFLQSSLAGAAAMSAPLFSPSALAQAWPVHPIRLVVPFPPGTSPDYIARLVAEPLGRVLGQTLVVDNRPGAGGNIGTGVVAHAAPDGYTFLFTIQGPLVTAPMLTKGLNYDPVRDLAPVTLVATAPNVLVVDARLGVDSLADFVRLAKARKGQLNYGSVGIGSASHLAMELFKTRAGIDLVHVPYQGFPQIVSAMLAGEVQAAFMVPGAAIGQVRAGKLKVLGVTTPGRSGSLPMYPSVAEQGYPGFEATSWQAVLAPAGTPKAIIDRVSGELIRIIKSDEVRGKMLSQYFSAVGTTPEALAELMKTERERWAQVIKAAGVKPE